MSGKVSGEVSGEDCVNGSRRGEGGLTTQLAVARLAVDGRNELPVPRRASAVSELARRLAEPLTAVLLLAGALTIAVLHELLQGSAIVGVAVLNAVVGAVLERRADDASRALAALAGPTARVRRDSVVTSIDAGDVVRGDLVFVTSGDRVPADVHVLEAQALEIDESMLTGESLAVEKHVGDHAFAGTVVTAGSASGVVVEVGARTRMGGIAALLDARPPATPLQRQLVRLTGTLGWLSVCIGAAAAATTYARTGGAENRVGDALLVGVALAVAAVPEGLPTAVTSALAFSGLRLAQRGAIVRSLTALEGLGLADVLCTDKTGTLTEGRLSVVETEADDDDALWTALLRCNDAERTADEVDQAILTAAQRDDRFTSRAADVGERISVVPFDARARTMTTTHRVGGGTVVVTVKGAPEVVLARCTGGADRTLVHQLRDRVDELSSRGLKVVALAERRSQLSTRADDGTVALSPIGVVAFGDPLRPSAPGAVDEAISRGLRVVMVTGDHPGTARAIAAQAGMTLEPTITGDELAALSVEERQGALASAAIVARVDPATKLDLVDALHAAGSVVALTGDGVNDAPALQRADIGIAVGGAAATDVARRAAALVLRDGDLSTVVRALEYGGRIHRNLRATVSYLLTGNLSEVLVIVGSLLLTPGIATPLLPVQLLWINLVTDTVPALVLGIDDRPMAKRGERDLLSWASVRQITARALLLAGCVLASAIGIGETNAHRSQIVASLVCVHLMLAYVARAERHAFEAGWWRNRLLLLSTIGAIATQVLIFVVPALRRTLQVSAVAPTGWLRAAAAVTAFIVLSGLADLAGRRRLVRDMAR